MNVNVAVQALLALLEDPNKKLLAHIAKLYGM